jgi:hypothetical protein
MVDTPAPAPAPAPSASPAPAPAPSPAPAPGPAPTIAHDPGGPAPAPQALKTDLPSDWDFRGYLANGDADVAKDLAKYTDPRAIYTSLRDLQTKVSKGELRAPSTPFPVKGTDEQKTAWRAAQGMPASAEDYAKGLQLPEGVVLGEADRPFVDNFAKAMFEQGATPAELNRAVNWWHQQQQQAATARLEEDGNFHNDSVNSLRQEWGPEFNGNMQAFGAFKSQLPEDLQALVFSARTADGRMLGDHPAFIKIGAALGRELNPAATLMPADTGANVQGMSTELASIEAMMGDPRSDYNRGPKSAGLQQRYRDLVDALNKMKARGKAA